jgi:hypothetical protein
MVTAKPSVRFAAPVVAAILLMSMLVLVFGAAVHNPHPHGVPLGLAGPGVGQIAAGLADHVPGVFSVHTYGSAAAARQAVTSRTVDGAFIQGQAPVLYVASAGGSGPAQLITGTFSKLAGGRLTVDDLAPLPAGDSQGVLSVFLALAAVLAGLAFQVIASVRVSEARARLGMAVVAAFAGGLVAAYLADASFGGFAGHAWAAGLVAALAMLAAAVTMEAARRLIGIAGLPVAGLILIPFGMVTSGGMIDQHFLPSAYGAVTPYLPIGAAVNGLRGVVYFAGAGSVGAITVLCCWTVIGAAISLIPEQGVPSRASARPLS